MVHFKQARKKNVLHNSVLLIPFLEVKHGKKEGRKLGRKDGGRGGETSILFKHQVLLKFDSDGAQIFCC